MQQHYNPSFQPRSDRPSLTRRLVSYWMPTPVVSVIMAVCVVIGIVSMVTDLPARMLGFTSFGAYEQPWRIITSGFVHFGAAHLLLNMWALYLFGPPLERALGPVRFIALYTMSLIGGSLCVLWWETMMPHSASLTAGASGAIFGLFGALIVLYRKLNADIRGMVVLLVINVVWGFIQPGISWQGHLGGLIAGGAYGAAMMWAVHTRGGDREPGTDTIVTIGAQVVITVGFLVAFFFIRQFLYWTVGL